MVDCFDRIAVQMTEIALEPITQLAARPMMMAATIRLPSNGRRILLTVRKRFPDGEQGNPVYGWRLDDADANSEPADTLAVSPRGKAYQQPDDAFWAAVDALRDLNLDQSSAG